MGISFVYNLFFKGQMELPIRQLADSSVCGSSSHGRFIAQKF